MRLSLHGSKIELDVDLTVGSDDVTVGDVFSAAGLTAEAKILINGQIPCSPDTPLAALGLPEGSTLASHATGPGLEGDSQSDPAGSGRPVVELICVAGPGSGTRTPLAPGTFDLCQVARRTSSLQTAVFRIDVGRTGAVRFGGLAGTEILVDGLPAGGQLRDGEWISAGESIFRVAPIDARPDRPLPLGSGGRIGFVRSPRMVDDPTVGAVVAPTPPDQPLPPEPLSILLMLLPLPVGLAMALLLSPFYLMFILLSPLMALGRTLDGKRRVKRTTRSNAAQWRNDLNRLEEDLNHRRLDVARQRRTARRDLQQLLQSAVSGDTGLWRSRSHHSDFLKPIVGIGHGRWTPEVMGERSHSDVVEVLAEAETLPMCPVTVDLNRGLAVGIVGPRDTVRRLAVAVVSQLVTEHGPADVQLAALVDVDAASYWDHLKWLPHLSDEAGVRRVATTGGAAEAMVERSTHEPERTLYRSGDDMVETPVPVFLVDHDELVADGVRSLVTRIPRVTARAVVLADTVADLPAFCTSVVEIDAVTGLVTVTDVTEAERTRGLIGLFPDPELGRNINRALARFVDPDAAEHAASLPTFARLRDLLETQPDAESVVEAWARPDSDRSGGSGCRAILGVTETGPLEVDLLSDGPHALIAGTTGAGKSELLRTMIVSLAVRYRPDEVNFVLVDFKGGGAFDVFGRLPHNVGVVTDLDEHLASRALRCLRAELRYREHRLRAAGVSDLRNLDHAAPDAEPLPRLIIVVDEFATLAAELPEFLASLVDVAQRGRSLGIHMVLATQRPSGVVDAKIRANTNLRIALRVQDDGDSIDVIGTKAGADIDRRHPGRALARFGAGEVVGFQTALVSVCSDDATGPALRLDPFDLCTGDPDNTDSNPLDTAADQQLEAAGDAGPDDLAGFVDASTEAARSMALPPARVPWPNPLPDHLAAETLLADTPHLSWSVPFGLVDLPDQQRQEPAWWRATDGNVLVFGLGPGHTSAAVSTIVMGLAQRHNADELHLYVLDFVGSLAALRGIPHLGGYVTAEDDELLLRTIGLLEDEMARRQATLRRNRIDAITPQIAAEHGLALTVLAVANYGAVLEMFEEMGDLGGPNRLARIVRDGPSLGVFVFIAAGSDRDVPGRVAQQVETKLITRMADPNSYLMFGLRPKDLPELGPGRAIDVRHQHELQIAQFGAGDLRVAVESHPWQPTETGPSLVEELGHDIDFARLDGASVIDGSVWHLSIGIEHERLEPVGIDLRKGQHVIVAGPAGSGRTATLQTLATAARRSDTDAVICVISGRPEEWVALTPTLGLTTIDYLLSPDSADIAGRRGLIIIDGVESAAVPTEAFAQLAADTESRVHLAVGGRPDGFRTRADPWVRTVTAGRTGVALQPTPEVGDIFRCRFPVPRQVAPPGRAFIVNQGQAKLSQLAVVRTESTADHVTGVRAR